jgi:ankyrin repeat protein
MTPYDKTKKRPLVVHNIALLMSEPAGYASKNSTLMVTIHINPEQALLDLTDGKVSVEEINHQNEKGWTALIYVSRHARKIVGAETMISILLLLGANVNLFMNKRLDALHMACCYSGSESTEKTVEILLKDPKIDVNFRDVNEATSLIDASMNSKTASTEKTVEMLLAHPQIDVNIKNNVGKTALMAACDHFKTTSSLKTIEMLLAHPKIDINLTDNDGEPALLCACNDDNEAATATKMLLKKTVDINYQDKEGYTALMIACTSHTNPNEKVVEALLQHPEINLNLKNKGGQTALMMVCLNAKKIKSSGKIIELLLKHPTLDVNLTEKDGWTALMMACNESDNDSTEEATKLLLRYSTIDVNLRQKHGWTALMLTGTKTASKNIMKMLIQTGLCEVSLVDDYEKITKMSEKRRQFFFEMIKEYRVKNTS